MNTRPLATREPSEVARNSKPSIWVEFTTLAAECKAVNLGQGFPDAPMPQICADLLLKIAQHPERTDWHQYTRGFGHGRLVQILSKFYSRLLGVQVNPMDDVLVTVGAYLALYYSCIGWLNKGDEVIVIEPAYDSYVPQIRMAGGVPVPITLDLKPNATTSADYVLNIEKLRSKITDKTKMLILNNPNNPTGKLYNREELNAVAELAKEFDLLVVSDEVYEWHVYPGKEMIRFASLPDMYERTITIGSAGKAFSATGWKLGWALGPANLLQPLKAIHQNCVFTCPTVQQEAVAAAFEREFELVESKSRESYLLYGMAAELLPKRDRLAAYLKKAGMNPIVPDAGYFMIADFQQFGLLIFLFLISIVSDGPFKKGDDGDLDFRFVRWLCREKKLATIPPSAFYSPEHKVGNDHFVRLCFFKKDETLEAAEKILEKLN
ncbi:Kynurenine-oxoglutarate transaminase [Aphelenchoides besseyi]|nr:Kynurenine-oxoglutarate transaminase [Aphelenchoides besseyi]